MERQIGCTAGSRRGGTTSVVLRVFSMLCCNHGVHQVTLAPMVGHWGWVGSNNHVGHAAGVIKSSLLALESF